MASKTVQLIICVLVFSLPVEAADRYTEAFRNDDQVQAAGQALIEQGFRDYGEPVVTLIKVQCGVVGCSDFVLVTQLFRTSEHRSAESVSAILQYQSWYNTVEVLRLVDLLAFEIDEGEVGGPEIEERGQNGGIPPNRNWSAWEDRQPPNPPGPTVHVGAQVETNAGNIVPVLERRVPQGFNPRVLLLDLRLTIIGEIGSADVAFRDVAYEEDIRDVSYSAVWIMWGSNIVQKLDVQIVQ